MAKKKTKVQQSKLKRRRRGRPRVTFYGSQIFCRLAAPDKSLILRASRSYDRRMGMVTLAGKIRCVNDYVRETLIREAKKELGLDGS